MEDSPSSSWARQRLQKVSGTARARAHACSPGSFHSGEAKKLGLSVLPPGPGRASWRIVEKACSTEKVRLCSFARPQGAQDTSGDAIPLPSRPPLDVGCARAVRRARRVDGCFQFACSDNEAVERARGGCGGDQGEA